MLLSSHVNVAAEISGRWMIEDVDANDVGQFSSIALDQYDQVHISYYDKTSKSLKYLGPVNYADRGKTIDSHGDIGLYTSIALDSNGYPHISYYDKTNGYLKYVRWNGDNWEIEVIDSDGDVGMHTSIALDSNDYPHISYSDRTNFYLKYAKWTGIEWEKQIVDSRGIGDYSSIAIDSQDKPHISYSGDPIFCPIKYAKWDGTAWDIECIDPTEILEQPLFASTHTSLALDSQDNPHVSYYSPKTRRIKYAVKYGIEWVIESFEMEGEGPDNSIILDEWDQAHIAYYDSWFEALCYARWMGYEWQTEYIDFRDKVGWYPSIDIDSQNQLHISYYDQSNGDLKFAKQVGTDWETEVLDEGGSVGLYTSIALDSTNNPHICYYDSANQFVKYARYVGNNWVSETIATNINRAAFGSYKPCIVLDNFDQPHVSFCDDNILYYARKDGSSWNIEIIDVIEKPPVQGFLVSTDSGIHTTSIALNSNDYPKISYGAWTSIIEGFYPPTRTTYGDLKLASWNGVSWIISTLTLSVNTGYYSSIAIDSNDVKHISYHDKIGEFRYYGPHRTYPDPWVNEENFDGTYTSITIDSNDYPHVSYCSQERGLFDMLSGGRLIYTSWDGVSWNVETVDDSSAVGFYSSIDIDTNDNPHIAYYDRDNSLLKYATFNGEMWVKETVDTYGTYCSLKLDSEDRPHISYYGDNVLKYAYALTLNIASYADAGGPYSGYEGTPIIFDASNSYDADNDELQYRWDFDNNGVWDTDYSSNPASEYTWYDDYVGEVRVEVFDMTSSTFALATVTVNNVNPIILETPDITGYEGSTTQFTAGLVTDPGNDELEYRWNFNIMGVFDTQWDSSESSLVILGDDYTGTVVLEVRDDDGGTDTAICSVSIANLAPSLSSFFPLSVVEEGTLITLRAGAFDPGSDDLLYSIDWGDGSEIIQEPRYNNGVGPDSYPSLYGMSHFSAELELDKIYTDDGEYQITVKVEDDDGSEMSSLEFLSIQNVDPIAIIENIIQPYPYQIFPYDNLEFIASYFDPGTSDTHTFEWDFGDGTILSTEMVSTTHEYIEPGPYIITLTVTDDDGGTGQDSVEINVEEGTRGNTPTGDNVQVIIDDVTITFSAVTESGDTTTTISNRNPGAGLANFRFLGTYYNIETSATYTSPIQFCIQYDDTGLSAGRERNLKIFHWDGSDWVDVTISLDTENNIICASIESLSWFGIAHKKSWLTPGLIIIGLIVIVIIIWFIYTRNSD